jgi:hypothetical protein
MRSESRKEYEKQWHLKNREKRLQAAKDNYIAKKEDYVRRRNKWYKENKDRKASGSKLLYEKNKLARTEQIKKWRKANPYCGYISCAKRRASKLKAIPPWLTEFDNNYIKSLYKQAKWLSKNTETKYQIDHIYPLQGKIVSGLHVPTNLQILEASENIVKSNKFPDNV